MADPPRRSDRSDPTRYNVLRDLENQKPEPARPETIRSTGGPQSGGMEEQQRFANTYNKAAQAHAQQRGERTDEKRQEKTDQPEKTKDEQAQERQATNRELAQQLGRNPQSPDRQREREQER
jgi:hypothetical protein